MDFLMQDTGFLFKTPVAHWAAQAFQHWTDLRPWHTACAKGLSTAWDQPYYVFTPSLVSFSSLY